MSPTRPRRQQPKALKPLERIALADTLDAIAFELRRPNAKSVQRALIDSADSVGYPGSNVGERTKGGDHHTDPTAQLVGRVDGEQREAIDVLLGQSLLRAASVRVLRGLRGWHTDRVMETCPICGTTLARGATKCRHVDDDGSKCGARKDSSVCDRCARTVKGYLTGGLCDACRKNPNRAAAIPKGLIIGDGPQTFISE